MDKYVTYLDFNNPIVNNDESVTANLGALYIIAALKSKGYEVDYRDYQISEFKNSLSIENMVKFSENLQSTVLVCCMSYMLPLVVLAVERIKLRNPEKTIILGGVGPAGVADRLAREFQFIDVVVKGEGEETLPRVLEALEIKDDCSKLERLNTIPGIVFRYPNNQIAVTSVQRRNINLDEILFPQYDAIDMSKYEEFGLITGRGCAYKCKFCDIHGLWGEKYYQRSMDNVFKELNMLVKYYGVKQIRIWDDTFTMSTQRIKEFCSRIKKEKLNFRWSCFGRVNLVDENLIEIMADAGCNGIFYGLESGSEKILKMVDKKIDIDSMIRAIEGSVKYMQVKGHFIWGFPFETCEDLYKTIYLYNYLKDKIQVGISQLWPYPTSPLYKEYKELVRFNPSLNTFSSILPFKEEENDDKEKVIKLIAAYKDIFTQFYYFHNDNFKYRYMMVNNLKIFK